MKRALLGLLALGAMAGCTTGRELVGRWTAVDAKRTPQNMVRIEVLDNEQIKLDNGQTATYKIDPKDHTVTITFPSGQSFRYGFSRSGEHMTLVDAGQPVRYLLDQG